MADLWAVPKLTIANLPESQRHHLSVLRAALANARAICAKRDLPPQIRQRALVLRAECVEAVRSYEREVGLRP